MNKSANTYCTLDHQDDIDLAELGTEDLDRARKKTSFVSFRLLFSEVEELDAMARSKNLDRSKFIRSRIFHKKYAA